MTPSQSYRYRVVDVFTTEPLAGNPLAVFPDASDLDAVTMQQIAKELNLAETVFVQPSTRDDCVARVRIFTPAKEMAFAGHPTIGAGFVLWQGMGPQARQHTFALEEQVGPVPLRIEGTDCPLVWLRMPPVIEGRTLEPSLCARVLGLDRRDLLPMSPELLSAGNPTVVVAVSDPSAVDQAWLDIAGLRALKIAPEESFCVYVFAPTADRAYCRMFAPEYGVPEDPASGSCTGPLVVFMMRHGLLAPSARTRLVAEQGTKMGRKSLLHLEARGPDGTEGIYVGGHVTPLIEGALTLRRQRQSSGEGLSAARSDGPGT